MSPIAYRLDVGLRILVATLGGYCFTWLFTVCLSLIFSTGLAVRRIDAVILSTILSFLVWAIVVLGVFYARSAIRACVVLLSASVATASFILFLSPELGW